MRSLWIAAALSMATGVSGCGGMGPLNCEGFGLTRGSPEFQRCEAARVARQKAGTRGAIEAVRSIDTMGLSRR